MIRLPSIRLSVSTLQAPLLTRFTSLETCPLLSSGTSTAFTVGIETICSGQVQRGVGGAEGILTEPDAFLEKLERYGLELRVTERPA